MATNYSPELRAKIAQAMIDLAVKEKADPQMSKTAKIVFLYNAGVPKGEISRQLGIIYQQVRNSLLQRGIRWD